MNLLSGGGDASFSIPTSLTGFVPHDHLHQAPNPNPNPAPAINPAAAKKKRNQPGTPDPDAEVIALSPKTLMATNRFICEICNKGFQRDQNLQLHRRGHNLPWKLRQRTDKDVIRKKVYICPEKSCAHHDPSRALGDLTGIKKHFSRKHGEKKWKCEKCSKKYAVQSDWKAHSKICGTREYKCDCGTLFSRKDSFITHRAFCDALADESGRFASVTATNLSFKSNMAANESQINAFSGLPHGFTGRRVQDIAGISQPGSLLHPDFSSFSEMGLMGSTANNLFGSSSMGNFGPTNASLSLSTLPQLGLKEEGLNEGMNNNPLANLSSSSCFSDNNNKLLQKPPPAPMSATALLQKAAQMGSTRSSGTNPSAVFGNGSAFGGLMMSSSSSSSQTRSTSPDQLLMAQSNSDGQQLKLHQYGGMDLNLTRDFLGMGGGGGGSGPNHHDPLFFTEELAKFASSIGSGSALAGLTRFTGDN